MIGTPTEPESRNSVVTVEPAPDAVRPGESEAFVVTPGGVPASRRGAAPVITMTPPFSAWAPALPDAPVVIDAPPESVTIPRLSATTPPAPAPLVVMVVQPDVEIVPPLA